MAKRLFISIFLISVCSIEIVAQNQQASDRSKEDLEQLYKARQDSATMNYTQADVDFMAGMIGHHAQALIMSVLAPENDASNSVQTLAARIINAQRDEINIMQTWLADRELPVPQVHIEGLILTIRMGETPKLHFNAETEEHSNHSMDHSMNSDDHNDHSEHEMNNMEMNHDHEMHGMDHSGMMMHDHSNMPGMLSQAQLEELSQAKGNEFDRLFLQYMIQHHAGAITMVKDLIQSPGAAQEVAVEKLAGDINVDQITEIERMRSMLLQIIDSTN